MATRMQWSVALLLLGACTLAWAQESTLHAELRREGDRVSDACGTFSFKSSAGLRLHAVYRSSAPHRSRQHAAAERIRSGRSVRLVEEHARTGG